ncbi:hypothetical protein KA111_02700 [Candidatus Woesebacteria bacterium]|nr:hypothetical protein [Candidatus Woesebacteria bacterium]
MQLNEKPAAGRLEQITDGSLSLAELCAEFKASSVEELIPVLKKEPLTVLLKWLKKLNEADFLEHAPKMLNDGQFKNYQFFEFLGVPDEAIAVEKLRELAVTKPEAKKAWLNKLKFDPLFISKVNTNYVEPEKSSINEIIGGALGGAGLVAAGTAAEVVKIISELVNGSEHAYKVNIDINDLENSFKAALQNSDINMTVENDSDKTSGEIVFSDEAGTELLRVFVKNSTEVSDSEESRVKVGECKIRITGSNSKNFFAESLKAASGILGLVSSFKAGLSFEDALPDVNALIDGGESVFQIGNLPAILATEIVKFAKDKTEKVNGDNEKIYAEVNAALYCPNCGNARSTTVNEVSCSSCGVGLMNRTRKSFQSYESDEQKLRKAGYKFGNS